LRAGVIALIVTPEGFPLAYEVLAGNTSDKTTLRDFLKKIEAQYGHDISSVSWKYLFSRGEKDRSFKS
jgi:transposase